MQGQIFSHEFSHHYLVNFQVESEQFVNMDEHQGRNIFGYLPSELCLSSSCGSSYETSD